MQSLKARHKAAEHVHEAIMVEVAEDGPWVQWWGWGGQVAAIAELRKQWCASCVRWSWRLAELLAAAAVAAAGGDAI
jgi:hypothetical protein